MPDNARQRNIPTGGTLIVWLFLLAVAALLAMVIYTFAATGEAPLRAAQVSRSSIPYLLRNSSFI
jgi:hypothetical protein